MVKFISFTLVFALLCVVNADLVNEEVARIIDLKTHLVKVTTTVTLKNDKGSSVGSFKYAVDPAHAKQLAFISFSKTGDDGEALKFVESDAENKIYVVTLPSKLETEKTFQYIAEEVYAHAVSPFPKEITQSQNQLMVYRGNHFFYSPYMSESQTTNVELPSNTIESYSKFGGPEKEESTIKYGNSKEFDNVAAYSQNGMKIHYENNSPFLTVTKLTRVIEVSHWGNIAVEEFIDVKHTGAKLKGSFSRYDYQRMPNSGASSVKSFKMIMPAAADDVYYRDEIGNISTSNLYKTDDSVDLEIRPRFPLFGGWKTSYYIGYNLPSYNYLYSRGDLHALKMRFVDHVMDDQMVEEITLKIILPEGAKSIKVDVPFAIERKKDELHYTYLDTVGRPVIIMKKSNLVEQHIDDFSLSYKFNRLLLLQEPLLIVGAFFLLFFTVIIAVRLDFSIAYDQASEAKMRVQGVIEQVQAQQAKRNGCYEAYQAAVTKYKASKDHNSFSNSRKSIEKEHKDATNAIAQLISKLQEDSSDVADKGLVLAPRKDVITKLIQEEQAKHRQLGRAAGGKRCAIVSMTDAFNLYTRAEYVSHVRKRVGKLNHTDASLKDKISHMITLAEKLVNKKINRDQYLEQDGKTQKSIEQLQEKAIELADNLVA